MFAAEITETVELLLPTNLMNGGESWYLNWLYADPWDSHKNNRWFEIYYGEEYFNYRQQFVLKGDYKPDGLPDVFADFGRRRHGMTGNSNTGELIDFTT